VRAFTQEEWNALITAYPPGTPVSGEVVSCQVFGVFVRLDQLPEVTALLEIIHFGLLATDPNHRIQFPADYPAVGARVEARVLAWSLKPKDVRVALRRRRRQLRTMRCTRPGPPPGFSPA
jgi:ribosomal protein S1